MTLLIKVPGISFTDTTIPIIRNDRIANNGTLDIFDALDGDVSWPKQGDPIEGQETWKSLIGANSASFAGTVGWGSGFTLDATADTITMPSTFQRPASGKGLITFWLKFGTQAFTSSVNNKITSVGWFGGNQWVLVMDYGATEAATNVRMYAANNSILPLAFNLASLPASRIAQIGVSMELVGGVYVFKTYLNGVRISNNTTALTSLPQPGNMIFGGGTNPVNMTVLRALVDDLSVTTPEALVALEFATYSTRFS